METRIQTTDQLLKGNEPSGSLIVASSPDYRDKITVATNWFSYTKDTDDARKYIVSYLKKRDRKAEADLIQTAKTFSIIKTYGWLARLLDTGADLTVDHRARLEEAIQKGLDDIQATNTPDEPEEAPVQADTSVTSEDRIQARIGEYLSELEFKLDHFVLTRESFKLLHDLKRRNVSTKLISPILKWSNRVLTEYVMVRDTTDKQIIEGYSNLGKIVVKGIIRMMEQFITDCGEYLALKKVTRKPRQKKTIAPERMVRDLFHLPEFPDLGLTSFDPKELVAASQVWVYNVKYKKLGVYYASDPSGLSVKGSTLLGFDPVKSTQKVLRRPEIQLHEVLRASENALRTYLSLIKTGAIELTGRINKDTILLRKLE